MKKEQQQTIERLRNMGLDYRKIGIALDLPRDKVRNYCKAIGLDGYAKKHLQAREGKQIMKLILARKKDPYGSQMAQRHTQWRNKMSNSFAEVYRWGCAFRKGVKIAQWGKLKNRYTFWQKVGIALTIILRSGQRDISRNRKLYIK